jgi:hypothetical protein
MTGFFQVGDKLQAVWAPYSAEGQVGATVGQRGVTEIVVDKADGPMGHYAIALVYRGPSLWLALPLHMMDEIVVEPRQ